MADKLTYVFVHGLSGWGSYDDVYARMPYWGMRGGDLMKYLRKAGCDCYAASVAPTGSAWDRACELYAQLAGTVTDYGKAHSERYGHDRYGKDFTECPLIPSFGDSTLVLFGHSFGGATIRLFAELMNRGDEAERQASAEEEMSEFFAGGMGNQIRALVTLAAPHNGTSAYDLFEDPSFDAESVKSPLWSKFAAWMMSKGTSPSPRLHPEDCAAYDMHIDNAFALNRRIALNPQTYYFSVPCSCTQVNAEGHHEPIRKQMEPLFVRRACQIGQYQGITKGGIVLDESWRENDGLVNTISSRAPMTDPSREYDPEHVESGIWNIMPTRHTDHMSLQGGLFRRTEIREFYTDLIKMIVQLGN